MHHLLTRKPEQHTVSPIGAPWDCACSPQAELSSQWQVKGDNTNYLMDNHKQTIDPAMFKVFHKLSRFSMSHPSLLQTSNLALGGT